MVSVRTDEEGFGQTLRDLTRARFGTLDRLAVVVGLSPGRISQILRAPAGTLSFATLSLVMAGFSRPSDRDRLHAAWLRTHAPQPTIEWTDDDPVGLHRECEALLACGRGHDALMAARRAWERCQSAPMSPTAHTNGRAVVELAFALGRQREANKVTAELLDRAVRASDPARVAETLWMAALGKRLTFPGRPLVAASRFEQLRDYLGQWRPLSPEGRKQWQTVYFALVRDEVLLLWDVGRHGGAGDLRERTRQAVAALSTLLPGLEGGELGVGREVLARGLIAAGDYDGAEAAIAGLAATAERRESDLFSLKIDVLKARFYVATGDRALAEAQVGDLMVHCERRGLVHYRSELGKLERALSNQDGR